MTQMYKYVLGSSTTLHHQYDQYDHNCHNQLIIIITVSFPSVQQVQFWLPLCIVTHIYSGVPLCIVTHNPAFTSVLYTGFHCSHLQLHLLCVYCH